MAWLTNWLRRKQLDINGTSAGNQSSYQMMITVYYGTGTDSAGNIYCGGNCKADFSDIRFTGTDGTTLLNYWIESITGTSPNQSASIWVQVPSIPTGTDSSYIYIYYNYPSATTQSNGANTFIFFDDFSSSLPSPWTKYDPSGYITEDRITNHRVNFAHSSNGYDGRFYAPVNISGNFELRYTLNPTAGSYGEFHVALSDVSTNIARVNHDNYFDNDHQNGNSQMMSVVNGTYYMSSAYSYTSGTTYYIKTRRIGGTGYLYIYSDVARQNLLSSASAACPTVKMNYIFGGMSYGYGPYWLEPGWTANFQVRNYASPEPTWSSTISAEQSVTLNISSTPTGAEIYIASPSGNGYIDRGVTTTAYPGTTIIVSSNTYDLKLTLGGYQDYILSGQTPTAGNTYSIQATLTPIPGSLSISSTPTGAEIYLALVPGTPADQGTITQSGGATISGLTPGIYNIKLTLTGYQDWIGTATVVANSVVSVTATFAVSVNIISTPTGADIWIDGTDQHVVAPATITGLSAGTRSYILKLTGYADTSGTFTATAGSTTYVTVTFPGSLYITSMPTGASIYIDGVLQ